MTHQNTHWAHHQKAGSTHNVRKRLLVKASSIWCERIFFFPNHNTLIWFFKSAYLGEEHTYQPISWNPSMKVHNAPDNDPFCTILQHHNWKHWKNLMHLKTTWRATMIDHKETKNSNFSTKIMTTHHPRSPMRSASELPELMNLRH